jgi:hypothetical protein
VLKSFGNRQNDIGFNRVQEVITMAWDDIVFGVLTGGAYNAGKVRIPVKESSNSGLCRPL